MYAIDKIREAIMEEHEDFTKRGWKPIFRAHKEAKILIVGQAPGIKTQEKNDVFRDVSGDRLREWLGIDEETFYTPQNFAVLPMDFYFPGKGKTGDLPPRKDFASRWHPLLLKEMKQIQLIILVGTYAQKYYLKDNMKSNLTQTVKSFGEYLPKYFPLVHPSPLNRRWEAKNPWFNEEVLPVLKLRVHEILEGEIKR